MLTFIRVCPIHRCHTCFSGLSLVNTHLELGTPSIGCFCKYFSEGIEKKLLLFLMKTSVNIKQLSWQYCLDQLNVSACTSLQYLCIYLCYLNLLSSESPSSKLYLHFPVYCSLPKSCTSAASFSSIANRCESRCSNTAMSQDEKEIRNFTTQFRRHEHCLL